MTFPLLLKEGWPQLTNGSFSAKAFLRPGWLIRISELFYFGQRVLLKRFLLYLDIRVIKKKSTTPAGEKYFATN